MSLSGHGPLLQNSVHESVSLPSEDDAILQATAQGAPVELENPLGHEVTLISSVTLNVGQILGSGIFAVSGVILDSVGSIGLMLLFWILAPIFAFAGLSLYSELASMFPDRSGAEVVYLEQAYPRPRFLVPITFAVSTVLLSYSAINAIVFAQYFMHIFDIETTSVRQTYLALAVVTFGIGVIALSTKWSLRVVNVITTIKVASVAFIVATGFAVLCGLTRITHPFAHFRDPWSGSTLNGNAIATALVKTHYTFVGWQNAFNVLGEVKGPAPVRVVRKAGLISLSLVTILFFLTNVAYIAAVPSKDIKESGQLIAALFFKRALGRTWSAKVVPAMIAISCLGNIIAGVFIKAIGQARVIREVARQGLLPYPDLFVSTRPFGTPLGPLGLKYFLTVFVICALPAKDAFNFLLDLASYPGMIFAGATAVGVWLLRKSRAQAGLPQTEFRASQGSIVLYLLSCIFLIVMPWMPPEEGHADVSFWYATYCVVGIAILLLCGAYYWVCIVLLPRIGNYEIVEEVVDLKGGARMARLVRRERRAYISDTEREPLLEPRRTDRTD